MLFVALVAHIGLVFFGFMVSAAILAGAPSALPSALHPDLELLVEPRRALVARQTHSPQQLRERPRSYPRHQRLPRKSQAKPKALRLERFGRTAHRKKIAKCKEAVGRSTLGLSRNRIQ